MNLHIDFNELVDFLYQEKPDAGFMRRAARINAHLFQCPECRAQYQTILRFKQALDRITEGAVQSKSDELKKRIFRAIRTTPKLAEEYPALIEKLCAEKTSFNEIAVFSVQNNGIQIHPEPNNTLLLNSSGNYLQQEEKQYRINQILTDNLKQESCQIILKENDNLEIYLDRTICSEHELAILVPQQENQPVLIGVSETVSSGKLQVCFQNIGSGEFSLIM